MKQSREVEPTHKVSIRLTVDDHEAWRRLAEARGMGMSQLIRWYIRQDDAGTLLHVTEAFRQVCQVIAEGFGGAVALFAAEAQLSILSAERWKR